jgi:hypothetical protein
MVPFTLRLCLDVTTETDQLSPSAPDRPRADSLGVSAYDRVSSLVVALIVFVGFFVAIMFLIWLTSRMTISQVSVPVDYLDEPAGRGEHAAGYDRDLEEPGLEEVEELLEPQMEAMLEAVTDLATTQAASLDAFQTDATATSRGTQLGDSRMAGPGGEGGALPRWERWEIHFTTRGLQAYARQLDSFGIELAAVGGGRPSVDYAGNLGSSRPRRRSGKGGDEKRLYMTWSRGVLKQFDRQLLAKAGVETDGRVLLQFYPPAVEKNLMMLEQLEMRRRGIRSIDQVRKTVFGVRPAGSKYEFHVTDQRTRAAPR